MLSRFLQVIALGAALLLLAAACQADRGGNNPAALAPVPAPSPDRMITLGDIEPKEPTKKLKRFQPLADYLAQGLGDLGIQQGKVVIARDMPEMARFLREGKVDFYFDSPFPTLMVQDLAGSQIIARRWKRGQSSYWSTFIIRRSSGIDNVDDFAGKVVVFEEPQSTSGYVLPAGTMVQRGLTLIRVNGPEAQVAPDAVGYFFSWDEENTVEMVLQGLVAGGGVSNRDYDQLPDELKAQLVAFDRSIEVPRQLVSARPGLEPALVERVQALLIGVNDTEEGQQVLEALKKTTKFDALPQEASSSLEEFRDLMDLVSSN